MSHMTPVKAFIFILIRPSIEFSICELPDNWLKIYIFTYSPFIHSIIQPDPSLIQSSILYKTSWKDLSRSYSRLITVLIEELK